MKGKIFRIVVLIATTVIPAPATICKPIRSELPDLQQVEDALDPTVDLELTILTTLRSTAKPQQSLLTESKLNVSPHVLAIPKMWKLGVEQTLSLTIYNSVVHRRNVSITLYVKQCKCTKHLKTCQPSEVLLSSSVESITGQATILTIELPRHEEIVDRKYYFSITSSLNETFVKGRKIKFTASSRGTLLIKTDKPIYKPEQKVKFCILAMDSTTRPRAADVFAEIKDAKQRIIDTWKTVKVPSSGYKCLELQIADEPPLGKWSISIGENIASGNCSNSIPGLSKRCEFEVKEFVLPRFAVKVNGPKQLTKEDLSIIGEVSAEYVFGEKVEGNVLMNFTLVANQRRYLFETLTGSLVNGKFAFSVPSEEYTRVMRYMFDPFCVASSLEVSAEVTEKGRGTKYRSNVTFPLVTNTVTFLVDKEMRGTFKPGLSYNIKVRSINTDNTPSPNTSFNLGVIMSSNGSILMKGLGKTQQTNKYGIFESTIEIPSEATFIRILIYPSGDSSCGVKEPICFSPMPVYSPTNCFLHMEISNKKPKEGENLTIFASSTQMMNYLQCLVVSHGKILSHKTFTPDSNDRNIEWDLEVTCDHSPRFQILCYFAQEDGEICGDIIELEMECCSPQKVDLYFGVPNLNPSFVSHTNVDTVQPQTDLSLHVNSTPNTPVLVSVYDRSLTLLADFCDSGKQSAVCLWLNTLASGKVFFDTRCHLTMKPECNANVENDILDIFTSVQDKPEWVNISTLVNIQIPEQQKVDISKMFSLLGISMTSNMYLPRRSLMTNTVITSLSPDAVNVVPLSNNQEIVNALINNIANGLETTLGNYASDVIEDHKIFTEPRKHFPESWYFAVIETNENGIGRVDTTAPDTITTWHGEAVAMSRSMGIGFSELAKLTVYKPFFVSLELPYSVNFGEKVIIKPVVFNFWEENIEVQLRFQTHNHLLIVGRIPHAISVRAELSASFNLTLLTSGIGRLGIKITAVVKRKWYSDAVEKILLVKSNCLKHEKSSTDFLSGHTDVQNQAIKFTLPKCALVGLHTASVVVKGDLMSLSNFGKILIVPTGCGEQNMARACINFVVATYLNSTGQFSHTFRDRITGNLKQGYQRELQFAKSSGGFAVFPSLSADLWLTAFVLRSLSDIHAFYKKESFVDFCVLRNILNYFVKSQGTTGAFELTGYSIKYGLVSNSAALTAYVMVALSRYQTDDIRKIQVLQKAANYLINSMNSVDLSSMCTYTTVLTAYALAHVRSASRTTQRLLPYVKNSIKSSVDYPGTCYVCNNCTMRDDVQNDESCDEDAPSRDPITSYCVETTAYTLLTLLKVQDYEKTYCLAQWLLKQQNSFGSFGSSQDTIVGLESLSVFAQHTFTSRLNLSIAVNQRGQSYSIQVTDDNRYTRQKILVTDVPGDVMVTWSGEGTAIVQSTLSYHGCNCCNGSNCFELTGIQFTGGFLAKVDMCITYKCTGRSNMGIVDTELPSGCVYQESKVLQGNIKIQREEYKGGNVVMYMDEVPKETSCIRVTCERRFEIKDSKPAPITLFDYYMPTKRVTVFYETD